MEHNRMLQISTAGNRKATEPIPWAPGLILKGAGFESSYYMKD